MELDDPPLPAQLMFVRVLREWLGQLEHHHTTQGTSACHVACGSVRREQDCVHVHMQRWAIPLAIPSRGLSLQHLGNGSTGADPSRDAGKRRNNKQGPQDRGNQP